MDPLEYVLQRMKELKPRFDELANKDELVVDADKGIDERSEWNSVKTEFGELDERRIDLEERKQRALAAGSINFEVMKREPNPFEVELRSVEHTQMLGHGKRAIDAMANRFPSDEAADGMTRIIERGGAVGETAARLAVTTGSRDYRQAYMQYMTGNQSADMRLLQRANDEYRAMTAGTGASGGYMVPLYMDPSWSISGAGAYNPIRDVSSVKQITTLTYNGSSGVQGIAELLGENSPFADKAPTISQSQITTYKIGAYIPASFEAFEDIDALGADLGQWFADAKNIYEATQFATGSGSAPHGVVTDVTAQAGSRVAPATGGVFVVGDVYKVHAALGPRYRYGNPANRAWMMSVNIIDTIRQFGTANNYANFLVNLAAGQPPLLLGDQLLEASTMSTSITTGQNILLYGDFSQFLIIDRVGMSTEFIPNVFDQTTGRPSGTRAWLMHWRVGSGVRSVADAAAFRVLLL